MGQNLTAFNQSSAGNVTAKKNLTVLGDLTVEGTETVAATALAITDTTEATDADTASIATKGGLGVTLNVYAKANVIVAGATNATSATTGSLKTAGGLGVAQAAWIAGLVNIAGVLTSANATDASSATAGGTIVTGGLAVAKKTYHGDMVKMTAAKSLVQGMNSFPLLTFTALTSAAAVSYTAAYLLGGFISDHISEACAATLDAPAAIVAAIPGCAVGTSFRVVIKNAADTAVTITLTANGASTIVGTATIAQNYTKEFLAIVTNITGGSEAVVFYSLGTSLT